MAEHRATIAQLMCLLSLCERDVLRLRFEEDLTQGEIGEHIGVSQMQVSRITSARPLGAWTLVRHASRS